MKGQIVLQKKTSLILLVIYLSIITGAVIFFTKIQSKHNIEIKNFQNENINGIIIHLNDLSRGTYSLKIKDEGIVYETPSLPIAFEVEKFNIEIGDSLFKDSNNSTLTFYKKKKGIFKELFKYEIE